MSEIFNIINNTIEYPYYENISFRFKKDIKPWQ